MHPKQLRIPGPALADSNAFELLRVWVAEEKQHISLATKVWDDPAAWGIMLVDLAKHVAASYRQTEGKDFNATLQRIREGFDAEWEAATDQPSGEIDT